MLHMHGRRWAVALFFMWLPLAGAACGTEDRETGAPDSGADGTTSTPDGGTEPDAAPGDDAAILIVPDGCTPVTACPAGVHCGRYKDPCSGTVFACGAACPSGQVCVADLNDPTSQSCQPKGCT